MNFYEIPEITEINRLPMGGAPKDPAERFYLDGTWDFKLFPAPCDINSVAGIQWDKITVPSNWTLGGFGDNPIYTNIKMPFDNLPPRVPEKNPTGFYRVNFTLPDNFRRKRTVLHIGGAESYLEVYVNGSFAGMGKDSRLPSEFDITEFLNDGENTLICRVIRFSDASYIEDQDQWWMAGIYRSVYLYCTGNVFFDDVAVNGDWDHQTGTGELDCRCHIAFQTKQWLDDLGGPQNDFTVRFALSSTDGRLIAEKYCGISRFFRENHYACRTALSPAGVLPWSNEEPNLYCFTAELFDHEKNLLDRRNLKCGFRRVEIAGSSLLINGKRVIIKGVNRHEHNCRTGKTLSLEDMMQDIRLLKKFNFNAVRTSHYPNDERWYDLCDQYGIFLVDEANVEAHDNYATLCRDPRWKNAFVNRAERLVMRDRSHVSIFAWSSGNESGHGENHLAEIDRIRELDPTRIIFHEGEVRPHWHQTIATPGDTDKKYNEVFCPMYPAPDDLRQYESCSSENRPVILFEYAHAMGNSSGSLADYWDLFRNGKKLQGGFIWDWIDQGLAQKDAAGRDFFAYGGDFGEEKHDFDFCCNGMIAADKTPHPAMFEFRHLAQDVSVQWLGGELFRLTNRKYFTTLNDLDGTWRMEKNGILIADGKLPDFSGVQPGESMDFQLAMPDVSRFDGEEIFISFSFTSTGNELIPAGWSAAGDQADISELFPALPRPEKALCPPPVPVGVSGEKLTFDSGNFQLIIDRKDGNISLWQNGRQLAGNLFSPNIFRAPTDNDGIRGWSGQEKKPLGKWLAAGLDKTVCRLDDLTWDGASATLEKTVSAAAGEMKFIQQISRLDDGRFSVKQHYILPDAFPTMPRIGVICSLQGFEDFSWFGRGPFENYIDRCRGSHIGIYHSTAVENSDSGYVLPQECGNRTGVRWISLSDGRNQLKFSADIPFEAGVNKYSPLQLFQAFHPCELTAGETTYLTLDLIQRGLGSGSCGPQTLPQYEISEKDYRFEFFFEVIG